MQCTCRIKLCHIYATTVSLGMQLCFLAVEVQNILYFLYLLCCPFGSKRLNMKILCGCQQYKYT
jgi:hypothetical protein